MITKLTRRWRSRTADDERGSLPLAMLIILLLVSLSAAALPQTLQLVRSSSSDATRVSSLHAAQTGLQVALGQIRAARDSAGAGSDTRLPCGAALTGMVTGTSGAHYSVSMTYYDSDPRSALVTSAITCSALQSHTPSYVALASIGSSGMSLTAPGSRTLTATYQVSTNNQNIPGGLIQNKNDDAATYLNLCLDGGSGNPAKDKVLMAEYCQANVPDQQKFSYRSNLQIVLNSSVTSISTGMCLQANPNVTLAAGISIMFEPCLATGAAGLYLQQWSFNDGAQLQGALSTGELSGTAWACFNISALDTADVPVVTGSCSGTTRQVGWIPSPSAGAGMAGPGTNQIVNFKQFGRCLDLTNWSLTTPLIAYPCKQKPTGTPGWNQRFVYNSNTDTISMNANPANQQASGVITQAYCLVVPVNGASASALRVGVTPCPDPSLPTPANLKWNNHIQITDSYMDKYTYSDNYNRCLTPSPTDFFLTASIPANSIAWIAVGKCDGSLLQKWNGDPNILLASPLRDANEK
ncbi:MAG: Beta-galactoside-specific lectin 3 [Frankiales bacterium]|nr:Beta-galactoside-specific lectin 3 [Frankiales bacterium]